MTLAFQKAQDVSQFTPKRQRHCEIIRSDLAYQQLKNYALILYFSFMKVMEFIGLQFEAAGFCSASLHQPLGAQQTQPPFRDSLALNFQASPHFPTGFKSKKHGALNPNNSCQFLKYQGGLSSGMWDAEEQQTVDTTNPLRTFLFKSWLFLSCPAICYSGG